MRPCQNHFCDASEPCWSSNEAQKRSPRGGPRTMVFAQNTVIYRCFDDFTIFLLSTNVSYNCHEKLNSCESKWTFWVVLGGFWASNEPSKLLILLSTSLKNHFFEHSASAPQSKPLLEPFWTVFSSQIRSQGTFQGGSPNHDFRLLEAFRPAQGPFGLWHLFPTPSQVSFLPICVRIWTNSYLISNLLPSKNKKAS